MSIRLMTEVWQRLDCSGNRLLTALALADIASDNGDRIYPGVQSLADKTRQDRRQVQRHLSFFKKVGWIEQKSSGKGGRSLATRYRINPEWVKGGKLPLFPDVKRAANTTERAAFRTETAVVQPPDPSGSINNLKKRAREIPKGSGASDETKKRAVMGYWQSLAVGQRTATTIAMLSGASVEDVERWRPQ